MTRALPKSIAAGVTFERVISLADYPAPGWVLTAHLRGPSAINLTAAADGTSHKFSVLPDATAGWAAGTYSYTVRATSGSDVREVETGQLEILPDLAAVTGVHDPRTHAQRTLEAIEAVLEKRASRDQERYTINNRELWRTPIADLLKLRDVYRAEVRREQAAASGKSLWGPAARVRLS